MKPAARFLVVLAALLRATTSIAADVPGPLPDPWVPPVLRKAAPLPPTQGAALQDQVQRKLRASFDAADVEHAGSLTREQARRGGLGSIAENFDRIDVARTGRITFDDYLRYLRARGAAI